MGSIAARYHELTKYDEVSVRQGPGLDWSKQPEQFKEIVSTQRVALRGYLPFAGEGPQAPEHYDFGLGHLSRLLFFTYGVTGLIHYQQGARQVLRAAPSAGALYPAEVYVAVADVPGLEPGLYNFQVATHELVRLWDGDQMPAIRAACGDSACFDGAAACVLFTGLFWRSAWRYRERGYRRVLLDTGHALANLVAYAPEEQCHVHTVLGFADADLNGLFFFEDSVEAMLACCPIVPGDGQAVTETLWRSPPTEAAAVKGAALLDASELANSATVALHRGSSCDTAQPAAEPTVPAVAADAVALPDDTVFTHSLPHALLHRRSARGYEGGTMTASALGAVLRFAFGANARTRDDGLLRAWIAVTRVDGLDAGLYAIDGAGDALRQVAAGDISNRLLHVSLGQEIAYRGAAVLVFGAPAEAALACYGDRAYRYLHLEAGTIGERFQLAAGALDLGACGVGGFFDDETAALIGLTPDDWVLYLVTLGK